VGVIVLTTYRDDQSIAEALAAGAAGYLTKDATAEAIAHAIHVVHAGGLLLDPQVHARLVESISSRSGSPPAPTADYGLTTREAEVLRLIAQGCSNAELADQLCVSAATVKTHINNLFAKLGVRDRAQAVAFAYNHGFAEPSPPTG
jgi:DNA-binding NarL/FixJ family response regulator